MNTPRLLVTILTGHGKTLLIQMLANTIIENTKDKDEIHVIIVCLNKFLHTYAEYKYGRNN
jgi:hypothetical protein